MFGGKSFFSFSKRQGLEPLKKQIQLYDMDHDLRNGLWTAFYTVFWEERSSDERGAIMHLLWVYFFKRPADSVPWFDDAYRKIREDYFKMPYNRVYDFLMFIVQFSQDRRVPYFRTRINFVLEDEFSGYRFVDDYIAPITDEQEIKSIQTAISSGIVSVKNHLKTALQYLSDKDGRDYRNSIKESISAVESLCGLIVGNPSATLGEALKHIAKNGDIELHGALKDGFLKIYGYTSDADGIRHGMSDEPNVRFEDAQYMLVSCSAFINYLIAKANVAGITLK